MACTRCSAAFLALLLAVVAAASPALGRSLQADMISGMMAPSPSETMGPMEGPIGAPSPAPSADSEPVVVEWNFAAPGETQLPEVTAKAGGTVEFVWTGFHGVWQVPSGACPESFVDGPDMKEVGASTAGGSASVMLMEPGTYWYACPVDGHCNGGGMLLKVTVTP